MALWLECWARLFPRTAGHMSYQRIAPPKVCVSIPMVVYSTPRLHSHSMQVEHRTICRSVVLEQATVANGFMTSMASIQAQWTSCRYTHEHYLLPIFSNWPIHHHERVSPCCSDALLLKLTTLSLFKYSISNTDCADILSALFNRITISFSDALLFSCN